jgi:orotidine-5'-phosphate decarboxylase
MTLTFDAHPRSSLIVALDFDSLSSAVKFAKQIADLVGMFKIGNQLFTAEERESKSSATIRLLRGWASKVRVIVDPDSYGVSASRVVP